MDQHRPLWPRPPDPRPVRPGQAVEARPARETARASGSPRLVHRPGPRRGLSGLGQSPPATWPRRTRRDHAVRRRPRPGRSADRRDVRLLGRGDPRTDAPGAEVRGNPDGDAGSYVPPASAARTCAGRRGPGPASPHRGAVRRARSARSRATRRGVGRRGDGKDDPRAREGKAPGRRRPGRAAHVLQQAARGVPASVCRAG